MIRTLCLFVLLCGTAAAQTAPEAPSTTAYKAAMDKMMMGMQTPYTGDADRDFAAGMLPHHQGAVDMAETELRLGQDPVLRKMAHDIIVSQRQEIVALKRWQLQHPQH